MKNKYFIGIITFLSILLVFATYLLLIQWSATFGNKTFPPYTAEIDTLRYYKGGETTRLEADILKDEVLGAMKNMLGSGYIMEEFIINDLELNYEHVIKWHDQIINNDNMEYYSNGIKVIKYVP